MRPSIWLGLAAWMLGCGGAPPSVSTPEAPSAEAAQAEPQAVQPVEITVYALATCPHCARLLDWLAPLAAAHGDVLHVTVEYVSGEGGETVEFRQAAGSACATRNRDPVERAAFWACLYRHGSPHPWQRCADAQGWSLPPIATCAEGAEGASLVAESTARGDERGVTTVPELYIDGQRYAGLLDPQGVRDYLCFAKDARLRDTALCAQARPPAPMEGVLVSDARCAHLPECDISEETALLRDAVFEVRWRAVDWSADEGRHIVALVARKTGQAVVPVLWLPRRPEREAARRLLDPYLLDLDEGVALVLGDGFDPTAELCDNGVDDNGDGAVDCADPTCAHLVACRQERPARIDVFIMSACPFAADVVWAVNRVARHLAAHGSPGRIHYQFIGRIISGSDGTEELVSLHGPDEVAEDRRMVCLQEMVQGSEAFLSYMECRMGGGDWEGCLPQEVPADRLRTCAQGEQGAALLRASFTLADQVRAPGSPSFLFNNVAFEDARTPAALLAAYCRRNPDDPACAEPVDDTPPAGARPAPAGGCR